MIDEEVNYVESEALDASCFNDRRSALMNPKFIRASRGVSVSARVDSLCPTGITAPIRIMFSEA